jgi:glycosyltransferase involved in cell wall biosynthesis
MSCEFKKKGIEFHICSQSINGENPDFIHHQCATSFSAILKCIKEVEPNSVILFLNMRIPCLFPLLIYLKFLKIKSIFWSHGINLQKPKSITKYLYWLAFYLSNNILMYHEKMTKIVIPKLWQKKAYHANNTLNMDGVICSCRPEQVKKKYGIKEKNIVIVVGRIEPRKRIGDLITAARHLETDDIAIVIVGKVNDPKISVTSENNIYFLGELYGQDLHNIMNASDAYCLPGSVGLAIIDSFYFGLPLLTYSPSIVNHAPEISYLENGFNGLYMDKEGGYAIAEYIKELLFDEPKLASYSANARNTYMKKAHISRMYDGFLKVVS